MGWHNVLRLRIVALLYRNEGLFITCSKDMIAQARSILARLDDHFLTRLVDVTELRLDNYFREELKVSRPDKDLRRIGR